MLKKNVVNKMSEMGSNSSYRIVSFIIAIRDFLVNLDNVIKEIELQPGDIVLDYGCGIGSFSIPTAKTVGEKGKVYVLDIHPFALKRTKKKAQKNKLTNIEFIQSDCDTGLNDESVDIVLLYDVLKGLLTPQKQLEEFYRILRPEGILCVKDFHFDDGKILSTITENNLFKLKIKGKKQFIFTKL